MVKIEPPVVSRKVRFNFPEPERSGRVALRIENLTKSFDEKHVLRGLNLTLERGDRLALTGPNGTGKSTLSKILAGMEKPDSGKIEWGHKVKTGYFAQEQAELMWSEQKVMDELRSAAPSQTTHELRSLLGAFLFDNEDVSKKVRVLSGGEKCRLSIARLLLRRYNFYILDEPTNHLDISSKDVLVQALDNFTGTFILVSHDRYVLERVCNKVAEIVDGKLVVYPGTYDEYLDMKEKRIREQEEEISKADNIGKNEKKRSRRRSGGSKAEKRRAAARLREKKKELTKIEKLIGEMEENQERIDSALADPDLFRTDGLAAKFVADRNHTVSKLMELYDEWSRLAQEIEDGEKKDNQNEK
jgi:ATP-binding cassette subfamily F protein 3